MSDKRRPTALLLVSDKTGIVEFAAGLGELGYTLLSAGSTARTLNQAELLVEELPSLSLEEELLGRISADAGNRDPIDLVAVNLYPVSEVFAGTHVTQPEAMEFVDVVPSALLRAAARAFERVAAVCDPNDYSKVLDAIREFDGLGRDTRQALAAKAFYYTAYYDSTVAQYLAEKPDLLPDELVMGLKKMRDLPYGENPHQRAALYSLAGARPWGVAAMRQLQGKPPNFNHYIDLEAAIELAAEFTDPAAAIFKHSQPCGVSSGKNAAESLRLAFRSDPRASTGGVAALNREIDDEAAKLLSELQIECVVAPDFSRGALDLLKLKKDLRLLTVSSTLLSPHEIALYPVSGGLLIEDKDNRTMGELQTVTQRGPAPEELLALAFAWRVAKHAKTYAAILAKGAQTVGIGSGQPSRLDALRIAISKSNERHPILAPDKPLVLASDGPLPLHCLHEAAAIGVSAVVQPGGTSEDAASIKLCDQAGIAMVFTGLRHYKH